MWLCTVLLKWISHTLVKFLWPLLIERKQYMKTRHRSSIQALADVSRSALCCPSNETRSPIANPPYSAQLEGTSYNSSKLHPGLYSSAGMRRGTVTQTAVTRLYISLRLGLIRNVINARIQDKMPIWMITTAATIKEWTELSAEVQHL